MQDTHNRPVLTDGFVTLRAPRASDVEARLAFGQHLEIVQGYGTVAEDLEGYTKDDAIAWVANITSNPHGFLIEHLDQLAGSVFLHTIDHKDQRAEIAIGLVDPAKLNEGIGTAAMRLLMAYGFDTLGLNRIGLRYIDGNVRAAACYAKLGFVQEGRLRERAKVGQAFQDDIQMSCLKREFIR